MTENSAKTWRGLWYRRLKDHSFKTVLKIIIWYFSCKSNDCSCLHQVDDTGGGPGLSYYCWCMVYWNLHVLLLPILTEAYVSKTQVKETIHENKYQELKSVRRHIQCMLLTQVCKHKCLDLGKCKDISFTCHFSLKYKKKHTRTCPDQSVKNMRTISSTN